jgi:hypothetical protein
VQSSTHAASRVGRPTQYAVLKTMAEVGNAAHWISSTSALSPAVEKSGRRRHLLSPRCRRRPIEKRLVVQDAEVPPGVPGAVRLDPGRPSALSRLLPWYNTEHHHVGLGLLTPADVHHGLAEQRIAVRAAVLATAYTEHPERFSAAFRSRRRCRPRSGSIPPSAARPRRWRLLTKLEARLSQSC